MHIILGGTGHLGSATARALLATDEPVTLVSRTTRERDAWRQLGAQLVVADIHDTPALREVFRRGTRAYILNPPADPATDTDVEERSTVRSILQALEGVELEQIVAASTTGARRGDRIGDFNVLFELEQGLRRLACPVQVIRGGYYMSNWDSALAAARDTGALPTMFPADLAIPMVAPEDLGRTAARLLSSKQPASGLHTVEGPQRYSANDVAKAFSHALGRPVHAVVTPREDWIATYQKLGFSQPAAESYARMTALTVDGGFEDTPGTERGTVTLQAYIDALVERST